MFRFVVAWVLCVALNVAAPSAVVVTGRGVAAGGGLPAWSYVASLDDSGYSSNTTSGYAHSTYQYGSTITLPTGTVTRLAIKGRSTVGGNTAVKLALYDTSGNRLTSGTNGVMTSAASTWYEVTGLSQSVSAGNYEIWFMCDQANVNIQYQAGLGNSESGTSTISYATFPEATLAATSTETDMKLALKAYVE